MMPSFFLAALWILLQFFNTRDQQDGWRTEGFNPSRTNVSLVSGPSSNPAFRVIASNVSGSLKRIANDGSLILTDGDTISSHTHEGQLRWRTNVLPILN